MKTCEPEVSCLYLYRIITVAAGVSVDSRWVTVAFTWNGLRALGLDEPSLASFPEEFREGMVARAEMLGGRCLGDPVDAELRLWLGGV